MNTSLPGLPIKSETFLSPALCTYKTGDEEFVAKQNPQRERITCALGLDVHYELNVPSNEGGLEEMRLQPFNPRISSPACPYNFTGKFIDEETFRKLYDDPVALGEAIEEAEPYDPPLYKMRDPRLTTKTQVIRDFGCKVPIDLAESEKLAQAVLNYYPDQYVAFLNEFVSNLFGDAMKHFLALQLDGYRKMLDNPAELNRISWGAFMAVRGKEPFNNIPATSQQDVSLRLEGGIKEELNKLALNGTGMTSNVNARDVFDVRPCIEQHIETLRKMHDEWCQGYATKEMYALVMMYYANEQGRRMCWDRRLLANQDTPDYDSIRIHVPTTLFEEALPGKVANSETNPDRLSAIHKKLSVEEKPCERIKTFAYSVGRWSGSEEAANVFLNSAVQAPFLWGWGHPMNLMHHIRTSEIAGVHNPPVKNAGVLNANGGFGQGDEIAHLLAPYIAYRVGENPYGTLQNGAVPYMPELLISLDMDHAVVSEMYVNKWSKVWQQNQPAANGARSLTEDKNDLVPSGHEPTRTGLRAALLERPFQQEEGLFYRESGRYRSTNPTNEASNSGYRSVTLLPDPTGNIRQPKNTQYSVSVNSRDPPKVDDVVCNDDEGIQIFNKTYFSCGTRFDPFLQGGPCFDLDDQGDYVMKARRMELMKVGDLVSNPVTAKLFVHAITLLLEGAAPNMGQHQNANIQQLIARYNPVTGGGGNINTNLAIAAMQNNTTGPLGFGPNDCSSLENYVGDALTFFENMNAGAINTRIMTLKTLLNTLKLQELEIPIRIIAKGFFSPTAQAGTERDPSALLTSLFTSVDPIADYIVMDNEISSDQKLLKVNMSNVKTSSRANQVALKAVAFRKAVQYALGPEIAYIICRDPLMTVRPWTEFIEDYGKPDNKKQGGFGGEFKLNADKVAVFINRRTKAITQMAMIVTEKLCRSQQAVVAGTNARTLLRYFDRTKDDLWRLPTFDSFNQVGVANGLPQEVSDALKRMWTVAVQSGISSCSVTGNFVPPAGGGADAPTKAAVYAGIVCSPELQKKEADLERAYHQFTSIFAAVEWPQSDVTDRAAVGAAAAAAPAGATLPPSLNNMRPLEASMWEPGSGNAFVTPAPNTLAAALSHVFYADDTTFVVSGDAKQVPIIDSNGPTINGLSVAQVFKHDLVRFEYAGDQNSPHRTENLYKFMVWKMLQRAKNFTVDDEADRKARIARECLLAASDLPKLAASGDAAAEAHETDFYSNLSWRQGRPQHTIHQFGIGWSDNLKAIVAGRRRLCQLFKQKPDDDFPAEFSSLIYSVMGLMVDPRMMYYSSVQAYAKDHTDHLSEPTASDLNDLIIEASEELMTYNAGMQAQPIHWPEGSLPLDLTFSDISNVLPGVAQNAGRGAMRNPGGIGGIQVQRGAFKRYVEHIYDLAWGSKTNPKGAFLTTIALKPFLESFQPNADKTFRGAGYSEPYGMLGAAANPMVPPPPTTNLSPLNPGVQQGQQGPGSTITGPIPRQDQVTEGNDWEWKIRTQTPYIKSEEMSFIPFQQMNQQQVDESKTYFSGYYNASAVSTPHVIQALSPNVVPTNPAFDTVPLIQTRAQLFSMLDAAAILWNRRCFFNPADSHRPAQPENGSVDDMHPWVLTLVEAFLASRESFKQSRPNDFWEKAVHDEPEAALSAKKFIGAMCDDTYRKLFPLLPLDHKVRDCLRKVRSLGVMWGALPSYGVGESSIVQKHGAWMPLSEAHRCRLLKSVGLFDMKHQMPTNPWLPRNSEGLGKVFNQSYHSVYPVEDLHSTHFREWVKDVCRYQPPSKSPDFCNYPFSQYGGTPVEADFLFHKVEACDDDDDYIKKRHAQLIYNRFGFTKAMRLGQQYHDSGILQDLYGFSYRPHLKLTKEQRAMPAADAIYPSNFMTYARNHAIIALASCNHGTNKVAEGRVVRNLYRLFVDSFEVCEGVPSDNDHVPVIMGFLPSLVSRKEDRPMVMYAGSLPCLNAKLEKFCFSSRNAGERICQNYKQTYLNDAALLFTRLVRADRRRGLHRRNYRKASARRAGYTPTKFFQDLVDIQDGYIEFLQTTLLSMCLESDVDMRNLPLHLLEPRDVEVPSFEEDTDIVGNDFLGPRTLEIVRDLNIDSENISRTQLAILSLMPPNHRILGTLRLNQQTEIVDLEHVRKMIQKQTIEGNKKVWGNHLQKMIRASLGTRFLEQNGPIDFSLDETAFKDPLVESAKVPKYLTTTNSQRQSSVSQNQSAYQLRNDTGPDAPLNMNKSDYQRALAAVRDRVSRDYEKARGGKSRLQCLLELRVPEHVKNELRNEYQQQMIY
jgi:hypothetical protein